MAVDITISFILRFLLAFIFLRAALHKVVHYRHFYAQLDAYQLVPRSLLPAFSVFLILVEACLAFTLLVLGWIYPAVIAAALMALYAFAMAINLVKGRIQLDCGCRGPWGFRQTISWALVIRNCMLVILALVTALPVIAQPVSLQVLGTIALGSVAVILLYSSIEQAIVNQQRQREYFALRNNATLSVLP